MKLKGVWGASLVLVAMAASSCGQEDSAPPPNVTPASAHTTRQEVRSSNKVLILGSSISGGINSREYQAAKAYEPNWPIDVVTPAQWSAMTATQFMSYRAIIIGDAACQAGTAAFQAAIDTRNTWGAIVDGDVAIIADNPSSNNTPQVVENGVNFVMNSVQNLTGMYIALGCAYKDTTTPTPVELLEPFGKQGGVSMFKVQGVPTCAEWSHTFVMNANIISSGLDSYDGSTVGDDGCAAKTVFTSFPEQTFSFVAVATTFSPDPIPGQKDYIDFLFDEPFETHYMGAPTLLVRGAMPSSAGCGNFYGSSATGEECDLGDSGNGVPNFGNQDALETCSWSCHQHWCGDGHVDSDFGEECDNGVANGRTGDSTGSVGACTSFCQIPSIAPPPTHDPVALCKNVTVQVTNQCGTTADINNGSYDEDGDLVGCVQNPAGPYNVGINTVTLTCTDQAGHTNTSPECTVTVTDKGPPTVALNGPANQSVECTKAGSYNELGATASDLCEGPLPQSSIKETGTVNVGTPNLYVLSYYAKDSSGNQSATVTRNVLVQDTLAPVITAGLDQTVECNPVGTFVDSGYSATDQCDGAVPATKIVRTGTVNTGVPAVYPIHYNVTDIAGHVAAEKVRNITVADRLPPNVTLLGPAPQTVECGSGPYQDPGAAANDQCYGALTATVNTSTINTALPGNYFINYKATDGAGRTGTSPTRSVTVSDTLAPVLALNGQTNMTQECAVPFTDPGATANDQCYGNVTSAIVKTGSVDNKLLGTPQTLTYNVKDTKNNAAAPVTRTVTVSDSQPPAITVIGPLSQNVECGSAYSDPGATANDACAGAVAVTVNGPANPNAPGNYDVTYSAKDPSNNTATSSSHRTVTVSDTLPPSLTLLGAGSSDLECGSPYTDPGATASDQCAGNLTTQINKTGSVNNMLPGPYSLHYAVSDGNGHSVNADRTITVKDTLAPTVAITGQTNVNVECGGGYTDQGATASDACAGPLPAVPTVAVNPNQPSTYTVKYTATDPTGNVGTSTGSRTVTVNDTLPPTIALNGPATLAQECGSPYNEQGATANDQCAGTLPVTVAGGVNVQSPASYSLTYTATDPANHTVSANRTVNVADTLAPTINVLGNTDQNFACGSTYVDPGATANDACDGNLTPKIVATSSGSTTTPGDFTITYRVTDNAGHEKISDTVRTVHVNDNEAPTLALLGPSTMGLECADPFTDPGATANDACFGDVTSRIQTTGSVNNKAPGPYTISYTVSDPAGQTAGPVTRTVTVSDSKKPVVTLNGPTSVSVECGGGYTDEGATANDACAGPLAAVPSTTANPNAPGNYNITYTATDPSGNVGTSATSRTVTVSDTLPPTIALNGQANIPLECATPFTDPGATANDQCAGSLPVNVSGSVNNMAPASYTLTYSATDPANHTVSTSRTVAVSDTQPPVITINGPLNDSFACGSSYVDPGAAANDACAGALSVQTATSGNPNQPGQIIYTYSAIDPSGNSITSPTQRTVTVNDNDPPTLALNGPSTMGLECGSAFTDPGATANDACFGDVSNRITTTGSVNTGAPAGYQITYNVTDPAGQAAPPVHRTVNVTDTQAPAIAVTGPLTQSVQCGSGPFNDPGATANDSCYGDVSSRITKTGSVNSGAAGSYQITYSVTDPSGNSTTSGDVRTVTVTDDLAPVLTLNGQASMGLECGTPFADPGATANDACAGDLSNQISKTGSVNHQQPAAYTVHYSVTDPSSHTASADRTVTVSDTLPPTLTLNGDGTQTVECGGPYTDPGATATDVCEGNLDAKVQVAGAVNRNAVGDYNVSYTVSDNAGHTAPAVTRAVQVRDTLKPAITVNGPADVNFECGSAYVDQGATASDQCAGDLTASIQKTQSGSTTTPGNFTITYSVTDPSGNSFTSPVVRTVHVNDNAPPTLALNGDSLQQLECGSPYVDPGATANDACVGDLTGSIVVSGSVNSGSPNDYTLLYNVSDTAGNSAPSVSRTVQVRDHLPPAITVNGSTNTTYECGSTYTDPGATATDACAGNIPVVATQTQVPNQPANFIITYSATDPSGNTTTSPVQRTVTMNDNLPPTIALNGPATQTLECSPGAYVDPGATATDACVGNVPVQVAGSVNMQVKGDYLLSYSAQDTVGNTSPTVTRSVRINDTTPPAITLNGPNLITLECASGPYVDPGATANDVCSGTAPAIVDASQVNTNEFGTYLVRFSATDASGNTNSGIVVRNVKVDDKTPPTLTLNGPNPVDLECGTPYTDPGATATDTCQTNAPQVFLDFNGVNNKQLGLQTDVIRYRTQDNQGNSTTLTRNVNVKDTTAPVISLTGTATTDIECGATPDLGVKATDLCFGDLTSSVVATPATLPKVPGAYTVSYSVTDSQGNTATAQNLRTFNVVDTTFPELTVNGPTDIYYECTGHAIGNVWQNPGATATDSCQGDLQVHQYNTGDDDGDGIPGDIDPDDFGPGPTTEVEGLYYVQYLAWDDAYHIQSAILSVYVQDTLKPVLYLNGPENVQTQCFKPTDDPTDPDTDVEIDPDPYVELGATGDDQCYGDVSPSVIVSGEVNKQSPGVYSVFYDVRDGAFNWADTISRSVEVIDNLSPKLTKNPPIKVFPADSNMRTVQLSECSVAWDLCDGYMDIMTKAYDLQITSNDPANDPNDIVVVNNSTFQVRAKRTSSNQMRVYTATFKVDDSSLNTTTGSCKVYVPVNANDPAPTSAPKGFMAGR